MTTIVLLSGNSVVTYRPDGSVAQEEIPPYVPSAEKIRLSVWCRTAEGRREAEIEIPKPTPVGRLYYTPEMELERLAKQALDPDNQHLYAYNVLVHSPGRELRQLAACHLDEVIEEPGVSIEVVFPERSGGVGGRKRS